MANPNGDGGLPPVPPNFFSNLRDMFGAVDVEMGRFRLRIDGSLLVAAGLTITVYKLATQNPEVLRDIASTIITRPEQTIAAFTESSILLDVLVQNKKAGLDLLDDLESGDMLTRLRKKFDNITIKRAKLRFDSIKLVEVSSIKNTKNFADLKKEAEMALNQFVMKEASNDFKDFKVVFCKVEDEEVLMKWESRASQSLTISPKEQSGHPKTSNEVILNGVPKSFSFSEAKRLLQELLDNDDSVTNVRYLDSHDDPMNQSVMVVQLKTPQLVEKLLSDSSAPGQVEKAFHKKMEKEFPVQGRPAHSSEVVKLQEKYAQSSFMMDEWKSKVYEAMICGVRDGFDLLEAQKLLQEIVGEDTVITDVKYLRNPDGSEKKSTIVALLTTPTRTVLDTNLLQNQLWFVKSKFQKSKDEQTRGREMLLVKQSMEKKRNLEEDLYVIDVAIP